MGTQVSLRETHGWPKIPSLVEVAAAVACGFEADDGLRVPEGLGDDVDHAVPLLDRAGDTQEARCLDDDHVLLEDPAPRHHVHEPGLILKGHEEHPEGGPEVKRDVVN